MYHSDSRPYEQAVSVAARAARDKFEALIERGRGGALAVIDQVTNQTITDRVIKGNALRFLPDSNGGESPHLAVEFDEGLGEVHHRLHDNALYQSAERAGINLSYVNFLTAQGEFGAELLAHNLNKLHGNATNKKRYLLRSVDGQVRGFLSDSFRRIDCRPILESFARACQKVGAVPVEGYALETKVVIKAMLPVIYEPVENEPIAFGLVWQNSDFGNGAHSIRAFALRPWCTNFAIMDECLRQVHLGKRLSEDVTYSQRTYELDTQTVASAVSDIIEMELSPDKINSYQMAVREAHEQELDPRSAMAALKKRLTNSELSAVTEAFNSPDVVNLPPGQTAWRMSNAISWVAGQTDPPERKLHLMQLAGTYLKTGNN